MGPREMKSFERSAARIHPPVRNPILASSGAGFGDDEPAHEDHDGQLITRHRQKTRRPRKFKVVLLNDDYTTADFVVRVLMEHFHKGAEEAHRIMLAVHNQGQGVAGIYPRDVAETKVLQVTREARDEGMPLSCRLEAE